MTQRRSLLGAGAVLLALLGCRDEAGPPTGPLENNQARVAAASPPAFLQLSAGFLHTCGVTASNEAWCWGANNRGQLGTAWAEYSDSIPDPVVGDLRFRQVSSGLYHTCGVTTDGDAYCWGANESGEAGNGVIGEEGVPVAVSGGLTFIQVDAGGEHTCGVTADNQAYCWGANDNAQLGDRTRQRRLTPVPVAGPHRFQQVTAGHEHTCGITLEGVALCWGSNRYGQVGDSTEVSRRYRPVAVAGGFRFRQVSAGGAHTCGVTTGGKALCWGAGPHGELGNGKTYVSFWPRRVAGGLTFRRLSAGGWWWSWPSAGHTCGITTENRLYCWGYNSYGQLGDRTLVHATRPVLVAGNLTFDQVSAGGEHTCARDGSAGYCWGHGGDGELGDGNSVDRLDPTLVDGVP